MLREDGGVARPRRSPGERKAAREWARRSADRAVVKLSEELARSKAELEAAVEVLEGILGGAGIAGRVRAILPALTALLEGRSPGWLARLRRNVALHSVAPGVAIDTADASTLRKAQHGPRLDSGCGVLSKHAAPFVPDIAEHFQEQVFAPHFFDAALDDSGWPAGLVPATHLPGLWEPLCEASGPGLFSVKEQEAEVLPTVVATPLVHADGNAISSSSGGTVAGAVEESRLSDEEGDEYDEYQQFDASFDWELTAAESNTEVWFPSVGVPPPAEDGPEGEQAAVSVVGSRAAFGEGDVYQQHQYAATIDVRPGLVRGAAWWRARQAIATTWLAQGAGAVRGAAVPRRDPVSAEVPAKGEPFIFPAFSFRDAVWDTESDDGAWASGGSHRRGKRAVR